MILQQKQHAKMKESFKRKKKKNQTNRLYMRYKKLQSKKKIVTENQRSFQYYTTENVLIKIKLLLFYGCSGLLCIILTKLWMEMTKS